ncbi:ABC transporter ATP-binding protein [Rhodococcus wratislaviensis]|uniref:ABC transporter ATP-binding protein n=1 Tax=Rhodococcus wratislaviensis TaxID=44752 RepID=UPI0036574E16
MELMTEPRTTTMTQEDSATRTDSATLSGVTKTFTAKGRTVHAVKDVDLGIRSGEYVVILGPSGCGKSTLLRCVAGLETPTQGSISLQGQPVYDAQRRINVKPNARQVGMVFQNYALWPHMTVEKNVAYPLRMRKLPKSTWDKRVSEVLEALECEALAKRLPAELSGGQQQRIALARALVYEPAILLLDEPLSNLDALLRVSLRTELMRLHRALGYTAIHITHDQEEALEMGDRVVLMRAGRIEQMGPPEQVYARPASPYAAHFLGVRNQTSIEVGDGVLRSRMGVIHGSSELARGRNKNEKLELFVRGRDTDIFRLGSGMARHSQDENIVMEGTLAQIVLGEGGRRQYIVDLGGAQWFAQHARDQDLRPGDAVAVTVPVKSVLLYHDETLVFPAQDKSSRSTVEVGAQ